MGTLRGTDPDGDTLTFSLVDHTDLFEIVQLADQSWILQTKEGVTLDRETLNFYNLAVEASDGSLTYQHNLSVNVFNVNEAPTDIVLTGNLPGASVPEGSTVIGILSGTDPENNALTFSVVGDAASTFETVQDINGSWVLQVADGAVLDYETKSSYDIEIQASDGSLTYNETFHLDITDVDDTPNSAPTDIELSNTAVSEEEFGAVIGTVTGIDPDGDTLTFSVGDSRFEVVAVDNVRTLKLKDGVKLDYETDGPVVGVTLYAFDGVNEEYREPLNIAITNDPSDDVNMIFDNPESFDALFGTDRADFFVFDYAEIGSWDNWLDVVIQFQVGIDKIAIINFNGETSSIFHSVGDWSMFDRTINDTRTTIFNNSDPSTSSDDGAQVIAVADRSLVLGTDIVTYTDNPFLV
jgi:hypothetical protein